MKSICQGKDTEAANGDNSQQNSCYERGPVSGESKRESLCLFYYTFVVFLITKYLEHRGVSHNILQFFFPKKFKEVLPITVEAALPTPKGR